MEPVQLSSVNQMDDNAQETSWEKRLSDLARFEGLLQKRKTELQQMDAVLMERRRELDDVVQKVCQLFCIAFAVVVCLPFLLSLQSSPADRLHFSVSVRWPRDA